MTRDDRSEQHMRDYLSGRMRHEMPLDLVGSIMNEVEQTAQQRRAALGWLTLAAAGVAVAAGVLVVGILVSPRATDNFGGGFSPSPTVSQAPTPSGDPVPSATAPADASPTTAPSPSATAEDSFGPAHSQEPAAAFEMPDECENPVGGYRISMPDAWYYNTEFDDLDACQWFAPTTYGVTDSSTIPDEVAIVLSVQDGGDFGPGGDVVSLEEYTVAGRPALRYEIAGEPGGIGPERLVTWIVGLGGDLPSEATTTPWLMARTGSDRGGELDENIDVLDAMLSTLELTD